MNAEGANSQFITKHARYVECGGYGATSSGSIYTHSYPFTVSDTRVQSVRFGDDSGYLLDMVLVIRFPVLSDPARYCDGAASAFLGDTVGLSRPHLRGDYEEEMFPLFEDLIDCVTRPPSASLDTFRSVQRITPRSYPSPTSSRPIVCYVPLVFSFNRTRLFRFVTRGSDCRLQFNPEDLNNLIVGADQPLETYDIDCDLVCRYITEVPKTALPHSKRIAHVQSIVPETQDIVNVELPIHTRIAYILVAVRDDGWNMPRVFSRFPDNTETISRITLTLNSLVHVDQTGENMSTLLPYCHAGNIPDHFVYLIPFSETILETEPTTWLNAINAQQLFLKVFLAPPFNSCIIDTFIVYWDS